MHQLQGAAYDRITQTREPATGLVGQFAHETAQRVEEQQLRHAVLALYRPDRWVVLAGPAALTSLATVEIGWLADAMQQSRSALFVPHVGPWGVRQLSTVALMWTAMMVAMMTPSTWPMVSTFAGMERRRRQRTPWSATTAFLAGYVLVWTGFSLFATLLQWGLRSAELMQSGMHLASPWTGGALLVAAGLYPFSSAKSVCLNHCRSPLGFLLSEWRDGLRGALVMGLRHGAYCTGCCGWLMALLFVAGVMNAAWRGGLAILVIAEKTLPGGLWIARAAGLLLFAWVGWLIAGH